MPLECLRVSKTKKKKKHKTFLTEKKWNGQISGESSCSCPKIEIMISKLQSPQKDFIFTDKNLFRMMPTNLRLLAEPHQILLQTKNKLITCLYIQIRLAPEKISYEIPETKRAEAKTSRCVTDIYYTWNFTRQKVSDVNTKPYKLNTNE